MYLKIFPTGCLSKLKTTTDSQCHFTTFFAPLSLDDKTGIFVEFYPRVLMTRQKVLPKAVASNLCTLIM